MRARIPAVSFTLALSALALTTDARALVTQPNGSIMPVDSANGEVQLYTLFQSLGEAIDYQADGATQPAVFSPLCDFTATLVLNETASVLAVGWYNADPNAPQPPADADIQVIVPAGTPVGVVINSADIRNDPNYAGGLIGFALVGWQTHFSEQRYNPVCTGCNPPAPWVTAVIYASKNTPNAYYLAFEDGSVGANPSDFNNDGDYNDYVYFLSGITCSGGGQPCDTGQLGVCAQGITQCTANGVTCQGLVTPSAESCDGLDDDCNGLVDDGDLCSAGFLCDKGACVEKCGTGEFVCPPNKVCDAAGFCVDPPCLNVDCDAGQVCHDGDCVAPCDGVVCPYPQQCRVGVCVDPCASVTCDAGQVCDGGVCVTSCSCLPCANNLACEGASGLCVEPGCVDVMCDPGSHCVGGACVDDCANASCPAGQICSAGACIDDPNPGTGGAGGSMLNGSGGSGGAGGGNTSVGGTNAGGNGASGGAGGGANDGSGDDGCGCVVPGSSNAPRGALGWGLAALLGLAAFARGRRRR
ncbi:MAG: MYXO-CTERM sorting domain-containing protein [Polyangiaceae bacterium]